MRAIPRALLALLLVSPAVLAAWPGAARAQAPSASAATPPVDEAAKAAARELANKGYEHYAAGEYAKAIPYFRDAEARYHAPTLLLIQAKAHVKLGDYVSARPLYEQIIGEKLADDAPAEFKNAQAQAQIGLDEAIPQIATLKIVIRGIRPERVRVTIDDVEIPKDKVLAALPQNAGPHKIVGTLGSEDGGRAVFQSVVLKGGTTKQVQLVFRPGEPAGATPPSSGGCASCAVAAPRPAGETGVALLSAAAAALAAVLRRRRSPSRGAGSS